MLYQSQLSIFDRILIKTLKCGNIPQHMAFIMDGNRRWGKARQITNVRELYINLFRNVKYINHLCWLAGVKEVTLYTFSLENFKRTKEEIEVILEFILPKLAQDVIVNQGKYRADGIRVNFYGKLSMLPVKSRLLCEESMKVTKDNRKMTINFAIPYTARDEIAMAIRTVAKEVLAKDLVVDEIDEGTVERHLYIPREVDCLVRTSGELRFSDFLLWQLNTSQVFITKCCWPEFRVRAFAKVILEYQKNFTNVVIKQ